MTSPALAQDHTEEGGHGGGQGSGKGGSGGHEDGGHEDGGHDDGGHDDGGHESGGKGQGGSGSGGGQGQGAGEGSGAGNGGQGSQGGQSQSRPVWAQEGIPEVELGRLNVARSPAQVIDRAYAEAVGAMTPEVTAFYALTLDQMETVLREDWDTLQIIDSPLQNLALLRDGLDGTSILVSSGINTDNDALLAVFLGTASDKGLPITRETALAVSTILGQPLSEGAAQALAEDAERIRLAIVAGHG
ncbi:hypothetical protein ACRDNQ_04475 [Palleronia sp. KMU-117]|uniref:hypothetical protein n=1 Tax=Palleronia sp. KMU-117 TaxID=3434108 RepID=UPI003D71FC6B